MQHKGCILVLIPLIGFKNQKSLTRIRKGFFHILYFSQRVLNSNTIAYVSAAADCNTQCGYIGLLYHNFLIQEIKTIYKFIYQNTKPLRLLEGVLLGNCFYKLSELFTHTKSIAKRSTLVKFLIVLYT